MYIRLARELGCTVSEMLSRISSRELAEQLAYDKLLAEDRAVDPETVLAQRAQAKLNARKPKKRR